MMYMFRKEIKRVIDLDRGNDMSSDERFDSIYQGIGKLVVEFQGLDSSIENLVFSLTTLSHRQFRIFISNMSFRQKLELANALMLDLHKSDDVFRVNESVLDASRALINSCEVCEGDRNRILHSYWLLGTKMVPELAMRWKEGSRGRAGYKLSPGSDVPDELSKTVFSVSRCADEVRSFTQDLSVSYSRMHGLVGMGGVVDYEKLRSFIWDSALARKDQ